MSSLRYYHYHHYYYYYYYYYYHYYYYYNHIKEDQKNWTPFEYENKLLFISSHGPHFRVVDVIISNDKKPWMGTGKTKSLSDIIDDNGNLYHAWSKEYGSMRGGSQGNTNNTNTDFNTNTNTNLSNENK